jgi:2-oxoglutarate ferredoxin oxidoreductase subunit alpha
MDYLRLRAFPFDDGVRDFIDSHETVFVVDQNRDAQMRSLLTLETGADPARLVPLLHYKGMPLLSDFIVAGVQSHVGKEAAA